MAPEIIEGKGHGTEVDWWSVGILLYEMFVGIPPFRSGNKQTLQKKITAEKIQYPKYLGNDALKLLKGLLERDPKKRLGGGATGSADVKAHPFFKKIDWKKLESMQVPSPFKPTLSTAESVENFDKVRAMGPG
jgi:serine/threonine protein kinase